MTSIKFRPFDDYSKLKSDFPDPSIFGEKTEQNGWHFPEINLRSRDVRQKDLSCYHMRDTNFDTLTKWPFDPKKCPQGYDHLEKILEYGKNPGLGIQELHQKGIDGRGLRMAIIDQVLGDHQEYHDKILSYKEIGDIRPDRNASMHGSAVTSIAVGDTCGVAPKAKVYYWGVTNFDNKNGERHLFADNYAKALEEILALNKTLPKDKKIQVVSVSWGGQAVPKIDGSDKWLKVLEQAKKDGLFVCTCASHIEYGLDYNGLNRNPISNPNNVGSYQEGSFGETIQSIKKRLTLEQWKRFKYFKKRSIFVPMDHRTTAAPNGYHDYVHYFGGGMSWTTPWVAGMFLLARQIDPNITPEHFWKLGIKTAHWREDICANIIQPKKLIMAIQKEMKLNQTKNHSLIKRLKKHSVKKTRSKDQQSRI